MLEDCFRGMLAKFVGIKPKKLFLRSLLQGLIVQLCRPPLFAMFNAPHINIQ